jgi:uncharacterized membrane protein (UPF0127 family)
VGDNRRVAAHVDLTRADGELVCSCRVATSFASRFRGLMGVARLPPGSGLLLPGTSSVHTHFMRFPIDAVFLDSERRIVKVVKALRPWRMAAAKAAASVLELSAGECERLELAQGDLLLETVR